MAVQIQIPPSRSNKEAGAESMRMKPRNQLEEFCEDTTMDGWYYLAKKGIGKIRRAYWIGVVLCSLFLSGYFIYSATNEYLDASVIITVDSVTGSLDKVIFPSVVICNQNQVNTCFQKPVRELSITTSVKYEGGALLNAERGQGYCNQSLKINSSHNKFVRQHD